jgi:hypothetical protein
MAAEGRWFIRCGLVGQSHERQSLPLRSARIVSLSNRDISGDGSFDPQ